MADVIDDVTETTPSAPKKGITGGKLFLAVLLAAAGIYLAATAFAAISMLRGVASSSSPEHGHKIDGVITPSESAADLERFHLDVAATSSASGSRANPNNVDCSYVFVQLWKITGQMPETSTSCEENKAAFAAHVPTGQ